MEEETTFLYILWQKTKQKCRFFFLYESLYKPFNCLILNRFS